MIRLIAFDADDTLWHNETFYTLAKDRFQELLAPYREPEAARERLDQIEEVNVRHYGYGIKSFALSMIEAALDISNGEIDGKNLVRILDIVKGMLVAEIEPLGAVEKILAELSRSYPLMLITKGDYFEQQQKVDRSGLAKYFNYIEIVVDKTPETYRRVLAKYSIEPQGLLMVGNSLRSDILPVLQIGGQAVYIPYAGTWAHESVDAKLLADLVYFELESLAQLPALVTQIAEGAVSL